MKFELATVQDQSFSGPQAGGTLLADLVDHFKRGDGLDLHFRQRFSHAVTEDWCPAVGSVRRMVQNRRLRLEVRPAPEIFLRGDGGLRVGDACDVFGVERAQSLGRTLVRHESRRRHFLACGLSS